MYSLGEEVLRIHNLEIRKFVDKALLEAPPYFWTKPSSSTGKYHPPDEHGEGGLVLHTKRVCKAAEVLMKAQAPPIQMDVIRASCILHDIARYGLGETPSQHSLQNHAELGADFVKMMGGPSTLFIEECVRRHMGKWGKEVPETKEEWIVHLADMIASQYTP